MRGKFRRSSPKENKIYHTTAGWNSVYTKWQQKTPGLIIYFFVALDRKLFSASGMHFSMKGLSEVQKAARRGDFNDGCLALWERAREWKRFQGCFYVIISDAGRWDADQNRGVEVSADTNKRDTETPFGRPAQGRQTDQLTINRQSTCEKILLCIAFFIHPLEHSPRNEWRWDKKYFIIPRRARARHHSARRRNLTKAPKSEKVFYLVELITPTPIYFVLAAIAAGPEKRVLFSPQNIIHTNGHHWIPAWDCAV